MRAGGLCSGVFEQTKSRKMGPMSRVLIGFFICLKVREPVLWEDVDIREDLT